MYKISRALNLYSKLTTAQRTSSLFREEPVVMGRTLRRASKPFLISDEQYEIHGSKLEHLAKSGSITIEKLEEKKQAKGKTKILAVNDEINSFETPALDSSDAKGETTPASDNLENPQGLSKKVRAKKGD